jgi:thioredoxin-like negative regulator of GroEL
MIIDNKFETVEANKIHQILQKLNGGSAIITFLEKNKANHQMIELVIKSLAEEYPQIKFMRTYAEQNDPFLAKLNLHRLPVTFFLKGTRVLGWFEGLESKNQIREYIKSYLKAEK